MSVGFELTHHRVLTRSNFQYSCVLVQGFALCLPGGYILHYGRKWLM